MRLATGTASRFSLGIYTADADCSCVYTATTAHSLVENVTIIVRQKLSFPEHEAREIHFVKCNEGQKHT